METRKLYYEDCHTKIFEATITGCTESSSGWLVTLDATAFYPEGGGQPSDKGTLGDSTVSDVQEQGTEVVHLCDRPLVVGSTVRGCIDWERRMDLMQQHSGEHIVSGIIHQRFGWHNVGFHMGAELVTIDFDGPIPADALQEIENAANAAVWENLAVNCYYPTEEELPQVPYRRKKDLPWPVRIVEIPGIDLCACCGTQVKRTGEVGLIKLFSCVKFHEGVRIEMACGKRALRILNTAYAQNQQISQLFSAKIPETAQAAQRVNEALNAEKFRATALEKRLFSYIAQGYAEKTMGVHFETNLSPAANRELCDAIADVCDLAVALSGTDQAGYSLCIISRTQDAKALGSAAVQALQGRGGGKREAFQGTLAASQAEIAAFFAQFYQTEK